MAKRNSLGFNPLQETLLGSMDAPIFGEQVTSKARAELIAGQQPRIEAIMGDGHWHTLPQLQKETKQRFGKLYSETSISARLRGMRRRGFTVVRERTRAGSNLYQYRAEKIDPVQAAASERQRTAAIFDAYCGVECEATA